MTPINKLSCLLAISGALACVGPTDSRPSPLEVTKADPLKADTSAEALFVDFRFRGELLAPRGGDREQQVRDQLLYSVGQLNGSNSIGRLDHVRLTNVVAEPTGLNGVRITYDAVMPVAWGDRGDIPTHYELHLPRDISYGAQQVFAERYMGSCARHGTDHVSASNFWYYYRPDRWDCEIDDEDVSVMIAGVHPNLSQTSGRFPEYDRIWADDAFKVVAIFGKEQGGTTGSDAGIRGYNRFLEEMGTELRRHTLVTEPMGFGRNPGDETPEVIFSATRADGRTIEVVAMLIDSVYQPGWAFDERYAELTPDADLVVYNGHSGRGSNIRRLAEKGDWARGQYTVVFMNGCDTYAYVDDALYEAHAAINPDDPLGWKYVDVVTNAMPSFFRDMPYATMALFRGLADVDNPSTYEQIFTHISDAQVVLVSGEADNTFVPGAADPNDPPPPAWAGMNEGGSLRRNEEHRFVTPRLPVGSYRFRMTGAGDADLYLRVGAAPTLARYECRPYKVSSDEICDVDLPAATHLEVMIRGAEDAEYVLTGTSI